MTKAETKIYIARYTILHDGDSYNENDEIALTASQAAQLLGVGAIADKADETATNPTAPAKKK